MADLDPRALAVVLRVVYDGPPQAGKTSSVRSLATSFGRQVYTPEERDGRTVYFDLLEHTGGRFEGAPIHCEIASVPGQRRWTRRRGYFLDRADVVVFVGDTTARRWPDTVERLRQLRADLDGRAGPPVGLVLQANKRDALDAVPLAEVCARAADARIAVIESIATNGTGIREAFVFAVRLALDRLREERRHHGPSPRTGFHGDGKLELLELLKQIVPEQGLGQERFSAHDDTLGVPRPPSESAPSGFIWPPIEGRILLRAASPELEAPRVTENGDVVAGLDRSWRLHSPARATFREIDEARTALLDWARQHAASSILSRRRCIVLAETGTGGWRLWQIVRREPTLRELASATADQLLREAKAACAAAPLRLPCTLDTIGLGELQRPVYVGLVPAYEPSASARA